METCEVEGCGSKRHSRFQRKGKWYCQRHYTQMRKNGSVQKRTQRDPNEIILHKTYAEILLYNRKQEEVGRTKIDLEDVERIKKIKWHLNGDDSVVNRDPKKDILFMLSRVILRAKKGMEVDHINHNRLDNRKANLRVVNRTQNKINRRGFKGYHLHRNKNKPERWRVVLRQYKKVLFEKEFETEEEAAKCVKKMRKKIHGEYACLDKIDQP